jgi:predicted transcriptional regulator
MQTRTRLADFMDARRLRAHIIADMAEVSRRHVINLRFGKCDPTRNVMVKIARACSASLKRKVRVAELFDLGDE